MTTTSDTYEGWANRETWAFWLHVTNDQGWYEMVREYVTSLYDGMTPDEYRTENGGAPMDYELGEGVVEYVKETIDDFAEQSTYTDMFGTTVTREPGNRLRMMRDEIGSFWRIDYAEIGAAARELVNES